MNKYIVIGVGVLLVAVAAWALLGNTAGTNKVLVSPTPAAVASPSAQPSESERMVNLTKAGFEPGTITVKVGTKVVWINKSGSMGNVSSDLHPIHTLWPFLNLGNFGDGSSVEVTFDKTGTFTYHNHLNPSQTGEVAVEK